MRFSQGLSGWPHKASVSSLCPRFSVSEWSFNSFKPLSRSQQRVQVIGHGRVYPFRPDVDRPEQISLPADVEVFKKNQWKFKMAVYLRILGKRKEPVLSVDNFDRVQALFGPLPRLFLRALRQY